MTYIRVRDFLDDVAIGNIDIVENITQVLKKTESFSDHNYFYHLNHDAISQAKNIQLRIKSGEKLKLAGLPISVKDCICVKGLESSAGSKILAGYKPLFDATCVDRLKREGAIVIGKTTQDEFGFGSFSTNTHLVPKNPHDLSRTCGGSSGGSAGISAKADFAHLGVAESTGGSISCPASFCGVMGLTPTYGRVSRYGLIDYANSLDKIGLMSKNIEELKMGLQIMSGQDGFDSTALAQFTFSNSKIKKIAIIKESMQGISEGVKLNVMRSIQHLEDLGIKTDEISLPISSKYSLSAYYIIAMTEASTNLAKYCGLRYGATKEIEGNFNEFFSNLRSSALGIEAKRRIVLGTYARQAGFRDAYYLKAMKARTLIIQEYKKAFKDYDLLLTPTMPTIAPKFSEIDQLTPLESYMMDILTVGPNLSGLPHLSMDCGISNSMPVGINFISDHMQESKLLSMGELIEHK